MAEQQRLFNLSGGHTIETVGQCLIDWFRRTKGMIAEGASTQSGYFVQAKDQGGTLKKLSGLNKAVQVQLTVDQNTNEMTVKCGFGEWSDKLGAGAVGFFIFAPLLITAGLGAYKQSQLPLEIFQQIDLILAQPAFNSSVHEKQTTKSSPAGSACPSCGTVNAEGQKFCSQCGTNLRIVCPNCGTELETGAKFCKECGASVL